MCPRSSTLTAVAKSEWSATKCLKENQTQHLLHSEVQVRGHLVDRGSRTLLIALPVHVYRDKGIVRQASQRLLFSVLGFLGRQARTRMNGYITPLTYDPCLYTDVET